MRRRYGKAAYMDPTMDDIDVIRRVPEVFERLQLELSAMIRHDGGEPILDGVVSTYTAKGDFKLRDEFDRPPGAMCTVKMYGEFPD